MSIENENVTSEKILQKEIVDLEKDVFEKTQLLERKRKAFEMLTGVRSETNIKEAPVIPEIIIQQSLTGKFRITKEEAQKLFPEYELSDKTYKKVMYLVIMLDKAVKISKIKNIIEVLEDKFAKRTNASLNYVFNKLIKDGKMIGAMHGESKHHLFYGLPEWKSDDKQFAYSEKYRPEDVDFGNMTEKNRNNIDWIENKAFALTMI